MDLIVELYWSFRSPYSYLILPRIKELCETYCVTIAMRIVHPAAIRNPAYFERMDPLARAYHFKDSARVAEFYGLGYRRPVPDPIHKDATPQSVAFDQPLARRLGRLGIAATERGRGVAFCAEVSALLWSGSVDGWDKGTHLADAAARAGLDLDELDNAINREPERLESVLEENDRRLRAAGHWGVPTMVFEGEPFFGQDRFDVLLWRLRQHDLNRRP